MPRQGLPGGKNRLAAGGRCGDKRDLRRRKASDGQPRSLPAQWRLPHDARSATTLAPALAQLTPTPASDALLLQVACLVARP